MVHAALSRSEVSGLHTMCAMAPAQTSPYLRDGVSREINPRAAAVVTVGTFYASLKENIIPASAEFTLTVGDLDSDTQETVLAALRRIIKGEAASSDPPEPTIEKISTFPRNYNDTEETAGAVSAMHQEFGEYAVIQAPPAMASQDFGILASSTGVPSVFWCSAATFKNVPLAILCSGP